MTLQEEIQIVTDCGGNVQRQFSGDKGYCLMYYDPFEGGFIVVEHVNGVTTSKGPYSRTLALTLFDDMETKLRA